jgi:hypothetical protein
MFFTETEFTSISQSNLFDTYSYAGWLHNCTNPNIFNDMKLLLITLLLAILSSSLLLLASCTPRENPTGKADELTDACLKACFTLHPEQAVIWGAPE